MKPSHAMKPSHVLPMSVRERFDSAVAGLPVDRLPVTAWLHFGSEHLPPSDTAAVHRQFAEHYQPDLLKIHADYRLLVSHKHDLRSANDIAEIGLSAGDSPCFVAQKQCISALLASDKGKSLMMETVFSPFQNLLRNVGADQLTALLSHPQATHDTLVRITEATCEHLRWLRANGIDICFFATHGAIAAERFSGPAQQWHAFIVEQWIQPFDRQVLAAADGMTRILHAHGQGLVMDTLRNYAFEVLHVSTELPGNPTLAALRQWTDRCVMGGINEADFTGLSLAGLDERIAHAVSTAGQQRFILAPGCSLPSHSPGRLLHRLLKSQNHSTAHERLITGI